MHAFYLLYFDVLGRLAFLALGALLVSEDPHQSLLDMTRVLQCFSGCSLVDSVVSHQLLHVFVVYCMELFSSFPLLQTATEYLVQERSLILEIPDIFLIVVFSCCPLGEEQLLIYNFSEDLSDALLYIVDDDGVLDLAN